MPLDEILRNSAPAIGGLPVTAAAFAHARVGRWRAGEAEALRPAARHPAEQRQGRKPSCPFSS
jgi:hypothetical protein